MKDANGRGLKLYTIDIALLIFSDIHPLLMANLPVKT
jgi:hypothetical protein